MARRLLVPVPVAFPPSDRGYARDLGMIGKEDAVLAISYSGESEELIRILPHVKRFEIPLIGMARTKESSLGHL